MKVAKKNDDKRMVPTLKSWLDDFWGADRFLNDESFLAPFRNRWMPSVNIIDNKTSFDIEVAAPGMKKSDFNVEVENGMICISAEHEESKEEKETNFTRREFNYNSFERRFSLPENVDSDNITATYKDGVLKLNLKKSRAKEQPTKKIAVN